MRHRTRSIADPEYQDCAEYLYQDGGTRAIFSHSTQVQGSQESMVDLVVPNFRERSAAGEIIENPCVKTLNSVTAGTGFYRADRIGVDLYYFSVGPGSVTTAWAKEFGYGLGLCPLTSTPEEKDRFLSQAKQIAIADMDTGDFAFMEDLAEIGQTIQFIGSPIRSIARLVRRMRREAQRSRPRHIRRRSPAEIARYDIESMSNLYLQYRFALMPLVRSVEDALDILRNSLPPPVPERRTGRGYAGSGPLVNSQTEWVYYSKFEFSKNSSYEYAVRAAIHYEVKNPRSDPAFHLGLRLKDIPETAWAIVPFSFLVDRVSNISNTIRGLTNLSDPTLEILGASHTVTEEVEVTDRFTNQNDSKYTFTISGDDVVTVSNSYDRLPWEVTASDTLVTPELGALVDDITELADVVTIAVQLMRGR